LDATAMVPGDLPTTTPLKAANAPAGKIAAVATAAMNTSFFTGLLLGCRSPF
jgi:hypothetical protein